jgi:hypothetical protein
MSHLLYWWSVIALALAMVFLTELIRAFPWSAKIAARKPLSCDVCMVGWLTVLFGLIFRTNGLTFILVNGLPAAGAAVMLLSWRGVLKQRVEELRPPS